MDREQESFVLRGLKRAAGAAIGQSLRGPRSMLMIAVAAVLSAGYGLLQMGNEFLPPFNEGAVQINVVLPLGTSLETSQGIVRKVEDRLQQVEDLVAFVRKTGRAELDEHAVAVNISEIIASFDPHTTCTREEILEDLREAMADIPGIVTSVEQPPAHLISHMLSSVKAQVGIKLYGDDLDVLRRKAEEIRQAITSVPGVTDLLLFAGLQLVGCGIWQVIGRNRSWVLEQLRVHLWHEGHTPIQPFHWNVAIHGLPCRIQRPWCLP